jgi:transcriptional antiterminator RfaH
MNRHWYVLRSKPNKEAFLWEQLKLRKIESYYPWLRVQPVNPRARKAKPYFPGYVFLRADLEEVGLSTLQWMPGSTGLVTFGGEPAIVPENLINAIRKRVDKINAEGGKLLAGLSKGQPVRIHSGPFAGYDAIFDARLSGDERVRVLLNLLDRKQIPLELYTGQINFQNSPGAWPS